MFQTDNHSLLTTQDPLLDPSAITDNGLIISPDQAFELLESISEAFYGLDEEWRFIYLNHKAEQLLGIKREALIGRVIWEIFPEMINTQSYEEMHRALAEHGTVRFETFSLELDTWVEVEVYPTRIGLSVNFHDITQRKRAENLVHESEARLTGIINAAMDAIITVDGDLRIVMFNHAAETMFRSKSGEAVGDSLERFMPTQYHGAHHDHIWDFGLTDITTEWIETLGGISGLRSDDQEFPIEASISQIEAEGKKYFTVILRDVTERKQAEQGLARLAAIVTSSNDAIISQTLDRIITSWNQGAERIFGYSADEVIGKPITILIPPQKLDEEADFLEKIYADETVKHFDTLRLKKDGSEVFVSVSLAALKDSEGKIVGITKIAQNITERKQVEAKIQELYEQLEQLVEARTAQLLAVNKNLDSFAYVVSHDLKAPLRGITQLASWLAADYAESFDDEGRNMLNLVVGRTKRMHEMIEGILQYSRIGRVKENLTNIDLNRLVADVIDLLAPPESIAITVAADLPMVHGDEMRIRQVFQNLIGNAIKYMDKPVGKIAVTWTDQQTNWQFAIADTGPGIASQYHEKIFQIFQTLSPRDEVESTGIGLALVEKIIELHRGRVWLDSIEGQGTTFYFTLPKVIEENNHEE